MAAFMLVKRILWFFSRTRWCDTVNGAAALWFWTLFSSLFLTLSWDVLPDSCLHCVPVVSTQTHTQSHYICEDTHWYWKHFLTLEPSFNLQNALWMSSQQQDWNKLCPHKQIKTCTKTCVWMTCKTSYCKQSLEFSSVQCRSSECSSNY